ncbi:12485_t:CDS:2 [Funneliformis mosseae]|uniref:12485_t:CDS:1 n=1 Tax=Funneliformis mosseae TaxID=27381 RepID=A0A9N9CJI4_FUNMO|nr:12485_t:CDS:2 [Funneliformis mosseae]
MNQKVNDTVVEEIVELFIRITNEGKSRYIISEIGTTLDISRIFSQASIQNHPIAQYYLGICDEFGVNN